jgi:hypothetical protein
MKKDHHARLDTNWTQNPYRCFTRDIHVDSVTNVSVRCISLDFRTLLLSQNVKLAFSFHSVIARGRGTVIAYHGKIFLRQARWHQHGRFTLYYCRRLWLSLLTIIGLLGRMLVTICIRAILVIFPRTVWIIYVWSIYLSTVRVGGCLKTGNKLVLTLLYDLWVLEHHDFETHLD